MPLNILDGASAPQGQWELATPAVSTFVLVGANEELTGIPEGLAAAIADCIGEAVNVDRPEVTPPDVPWVAAIHVNALPAPLLCWPEADAAHHPDVPDLQGTGGLVVQTLLHPDDPLTCFVNIVRLLAMLDTDAPGVLDGNTGRLLDRELLEREFLGDEGEPAESILGVLLAESVDSDTTRVRTDGLDRCGRLDLQVVASRPDLVEPAVACLDTIAALTLETSLPPEGVPAEVGPGLQLYIDGSEQDEGHVQLVNADGTPPVDALEYLRTGAVAIYRTDRSARRGRAATAATWAEFLTIAADARRECLVEVPFEDPDGHETRREHVWMRVHGVDGEAVQAAPVHDAAVAQGIDTQAQRIAKDEVASWCVMVEGTPWGPEQLPALRTLLQQEDA